MKKKGVGGRDRQDVAKVQAPRCCRYVEVILPVDKPFRQKQCKSMLYITSGPRQHSGNRLPPRQLLPRQGAFQRSSGLICQEQGCLKSRPQCLTLPPALGSTSEGTTELEKQRKCLCTKYSYYKAWPPARHYLLYYFDSVTSCDITK